MAKRDEHLIDFYPDQEEVFVDPGFGFDSEVFVMKCGKHSFQASTAQVGKMVACPVCRKKVLVEEPRMY